MTAPAPRNYYRISFGTGKPLRIGLLLDSREKLPAFCAAIVEDIRSSNFAEIKLLVIRKSATGSLPAPKQNSSRAFRFLRNLRNPQLRKHLLYKLYLGLDARMKPANDPLAAVDCSDLLSGIEAIEVEPIGKKFVQRFGNEDLEKIRSKNLDVLLRFGFNILHGDVLRASRCGIWSYHHGDNEFYRGGPAHFWELWENSPLSGVVLQVLSEELDGGLALCKSQFATEGSPSVSRNRFTPYWGATEMVIRRLNELHRYGWEFVRNKALPSIPYQGKRKIYRTPTNLDVVRWLGPLFAKKAISYPFRREKIVQHWKIACRVNGKPLCCSSDTEPDLSGFRWIDSPKGSFWADPFAFEFEGKCWLFFEDYSYQQRRAAIACAEISTSGDLGTPLVCLDDPVHHYSYPHIFRAGSDVFMIPESADSDCVTLFRCKQFPDKWIREATLLRGKFVDTTVWEHDGLWWMMTTSAEPSSRAGSLLLFYSNSLTGNWQFHPANPISTDIRNNRGAGRVFRNQNQLIRPSQSCAPSYGYSFSFNEITEISTTSYRERAFKTITPDACKGLSGIHTYNHAGNVELIDGSTNVPLKRVRLANE